MSNVSTTTTNTTLDIALVNQTTSSNVNAYITGQAIDKDNALVLIQADGKTPYYPASPSEAGGALAENCAIPLGAPGSTTTATIPRIAGGRIWFSIDDTLEFLLNPGPGLVEPAVNNTGDANYNKTWDFCELTFNTSEVYANISYVDFVSVPIALTLETTTGPVQHVSGIPVDGLTTIVNGLKSQNEADGVGWDQLIIPSPSGAPLRALSPNAGRVLNSSLFADYYTDYVKQVWSHYSSAPITINTQAQWGNPTATVVDGLLTFQDVGTFAQPSAADIFSCSTGPFAAAATNTDEMGAITARLAAAFNRSTLLLNADQPESEVVSNYYSTAPTNHYSRIVHEANLDKKGYAFPYDDVAPSSGADQSGAVHDGSPTLLTVTVGGANAAASAPAAAQPVTKPAEKGPGLVSRFRRWGGSVVSRVTSAFRKK